jgi:hypothetical protein
VVDKDHRVLLSMMQKPSDEISMQLNSSCSC